MTIRVGEINVRRESGSNEKHMRASTTGKAMSVRCAYSGSVTVCQEEDMQEVDLQTVRRTAQSGIRDPGVIVNGDVCKGGGYRRIAAASPLLPRHPKSDGSGAWT